MTKEDVTLASVFVFGGFALIGVLVSFWEVGLEIVVLLLGGD
jgi:hypothetical protein